MHFYEDSNPIYVTCGFIIIHLSVKQRVMPKSSSYKQLHKCSDGKTVAFANVDTFYFFILIMNLLTMMCKCKLPRYYMM